MLSNKDVILERANTNLLKLFPDKFTPITSEDIEKVYGRNVLGMSVDAKTKKGLKAGYLTGILYFAPSRVSGLEMCPGASSGCRAACLFTAGRGRFYSVTRARIIKTLAWHLDKPRFIATVKESIRQVSVRAHGLGLTPVIRLNGTSDIVWEAVTDIIQSFPSVQFYDYTKLAGRFEKPLPANYHLTFSYSESNKVLSRHVLDLGGNIAVVFGGPLPSSFMNHPVIMGDTTDLRFLDKKGCVVGLTAKGAAKKDKSGFVVR